MLLLHFHYYNRLEHSGWQCFFWKDETECCQWYVAVMVHMWPPSQASPPKHAKSPLPCLLLNHSLMGEALGMRVVQNGVIPGNEGSTKWCYTVC